MNTPASPRWDLTPLYPSPRSEALSADLDALDALAEAFRDRWQGKVAGLDPAGLLAALGDYEALLRAAYLPQGYTGLLVSTDNLDDTVKALQARVGERATEAFNKARFFDLELSRCPAETHARWALEPSLGVYRHYLQRAQEVAPFQLPQEVENVLATKNLTGRRAWTQFYDEHTARWTFPFTVRGETRDRNLAELRALRTDPDRDVRKRAVEAMLTRFEAEAPIFAFIANTLYQDHRSELALRGHRSPEAPTLLDDELTEGALDGLMTAVEAHYPVAQEYYRLKARALGLDKLETCDLLAPYPQDERELPWESARDQVLDAFSALDPGVRSLAEAFFREQRIDAEPRAGKRDGAFCASLVPGRAPYVFMNYTGRLHDVLTLAHELGHGVHFALAGDRQALLNYWPTTPLAETASVFAEMVLSRDLLSRERDPLARRQLLATRIEEALGTIHRQVCFVRYERNAHARRAEGVLSTGDFRALWEREHRRLYADAVTYTERDTWAWPGISHLFHYRFYCYSYAFGQLLVFALYRLWEDDPKGFVPKYLELLSSGGRDSPPALLARVGIDVSDPGFWSRGLEVVTRMVEEFRAEVP
ncbi:MAG: M3 family oligoendopeptidase [Deltaproteobacteria bacterium]|nr:M3 family oligoendopeptidase [Deltaproteobacteria bacterium]